MKILAKEWREFIEDSSIWGEGWCYVDASFRVEGKEYIEQPLPEEELDGVAVIEILGGIVLDETMDDKGSIASLVRRWKKKQTTRLEVIRVPKNISNAELRQCHQDDRRQH